MSNRNARVIADLLTRIHELIAEHDVSYQEYQAAKQLLIDVGEAGEWPLILDVFVEHAVEEQAFKDRPGSAGTILGPYYLPDAPMLDHPYELPHRADERGERLVVTGHVLGSDGAPVERAVLDVWHADSDGFYSGFSDLPEGILRGKVTTGRDGSFQLRTTVPGPYTIPHDGPTGRIISACGWHPWRPAHIHMLVSADGYETLTTQLYIENSPYLDDDVARAVKDELIVRPQRRDADPALGIDFPHLHVDYEFQLAPERQPATVGG